MEKTDIDTIKEDITETISLKIDDKNLGKTIMDFS